jgi:hypothetical protein
MVVFLSRFYPVSARFGGKRSGGPFPLRKPARRLPDGRRTEGGETSNSSVVVAAGEDTDFVLRDFVDEPMLLVDTPGPRLIHSQATSPAWR